MKNIYVIKETEMTSHELVGIKVDIAVKEGYSTLGRLLNNMAIESGSDFYNVRPIRTPLTFMMENNCQYIKEYVDIKSVSKFYTLTLEQLKVILFSNCYIESDMFLTLMTMYGTYIHDTKLGDILIIEEF